MQIFAQVLLPFDRIVGKCRVAVDPHYPVNAVLAVESLVDMDEFFPLWMVSCLGGVVQHTIDVPEVTPSAFILQRHLDCHKRINIRDKEVVCISVESYPLLILIGCLYLDMIRRQPIFIVLKTE